MKGSPLSGQTLHCPDEEILSPKLYVEFTAKGVDADFKITKHFDTDYINAQTTLHISSRRFSSV